MQLHQERWYANDHQHEEIRNEEGPSTILEAKIWEPPDISQSYSIAQAGEKELHFPTPTTSFHRVRLIHLDTVEALQSLQHQYFQISSFHT